MRALSTAFVLMVVIFATSGIMDAQVACEVQAVTSFVDASTLQIDFQIKSTGATSFVLGTSSFVVNFNASGLDNTSVTVNTDGPWVTSGGNGAGSKDYNGSSSASGLDGGTGQGYGGYVVTFVGHSSNSGTLYKNTGEVVPTSFTSVGTIIITITNSSQSAQLSWRAIGSVTQVQRITSPGTPGTGCTDITSSTTFDVLPGSTPLPVELTSFTALAQGRTINLAWSTKTEINNSGFDVERQAVGTSTTASTASAWTKVGSISGKGTSNTPQNYTFSDVVKEAGSYNYRLKQIDHNGSFTYSSEVLVKATLSADDYKLSQNYPNPFNPSTKFDFAVKSTEHVAIKVYNSIGQEVATLFDGVVPADQIQEVTFDGSRLASGLYFYVLRATDRVEVKKMLMMK